ncbi:uncharacterized protein LOC110461433 [Mizuhopecten yessoensis]|uniref:Actin maturation protease n=1 Tax=Mizuhopecten yessoensis TaxID=6573 RepID=A0A210Q0E4_MIZYE|nr:uncharacterized protein LOC110461433 [Mizuhopecten yessoensis]OWF42192.1 DNA replication licensing factor mcm5-A [Mizuhopecten yessoensis]
MPEGKSSADYLRHGSGPTSTPLSFHPGYSSEVTPWSGDGTPSRDSSNEPISQEWRQATHQNSARIPDHFLESAPPLFSALDSANFYTNLSFDQLDLDESTSVTSPFSIPIGRRDSSPNYGLSPSSLLYKYSNIAGMPEMDNRTVLSSVHDEANTINSTTTAATHTCKKPVSIAMSEHSTIRSPGQGAECNLTSGFPIHDHTTHITDASQSQPYKSMFTKSPGFDTTHFPTAADAIFHMHACDDQSFADSVDNLTPFPPHSSGIQDMDTLDIAYPQRALRKVAENFQRDQNDLIFPAQKKPDESLFSASTKQDSTFQQPFCPTVDDIGPNYFDSFYDNPQIFPASSSDSAPTFGQQVLNKNYCSETDSALLDVFFQEDSDLMYDDSSQGFPMKNTMDASEYVEVDNPNAFHGNKKYVRSTLNQHVSRPTKLQTAESTKVVAELLAGLLDDVDVPYYMNEIESGVTSTPDGKEVSFLCEPSSLSMANSWILSDEKNGLRTDRNQVDMEQGFEQNRDHQAENSEMAFSSSCSDSNSIVSSISSSFPCQSAYCESFNKAMRLPAPPPPPPPPRIPPQKAVTDTPTHPQAVAADVEQDNLHRKLTKIIEEGTSAENSLTLVCLHHNQVVPLMQEGPCCGLVALAMAKDLMERTDVSFEDILATSKSRGYTNRGEMFSAFDMGALAREVYGCECEVLDMETTGSRELLLRHLVGGNICLVPYDADANHEPCMKKGHKAHWTFLTGILFVIRSSEAAKLPNDLVVDENIPQLYHVHSKTTSETLQHILRMADRNNILVYGRQGKSRHTGLWSLATLLTSNANLLEVSPQRVGESLEDFVLPEDGIVHTLCNKIVILYK